MNTIIDNMFSGSTEHGIHVGFYEEDEPVEEIQARFIDGDAGLTGPA